jgi:succinate dehydrogenase / fumarate reductase cytochrome b subunit
MMSESLTHQGIRKPGEFKSNRLGLSGWAVGGRYPIERYLYTLHRLTGLGILAYFFMHIIVTTMRVRGPEAWDATMAGFGGAAFKIGEFLVFAAFAFHAMNGLRLVLNELGYGMGAPMLPSYPYKNAVRRARPVFVAVMLIAVVLLAIGGYDFILHMGRTH